MEKKESVGLIEAYSYRLIEEVADEFSISPMKMRKLLITAGVYENETSELISRLKAEGKTNSEIQNITGLSRSSVNGYLPYTKVIYKNSESSVGADRVRLLRKRRKACDELQRSSTEQALWDCIVSYQDFKFYTYSGLPFKYSIRRGKSGKYTKELIVDRRSESKTLTWSSVVLAFNRAINMTGQIIDKPKALGDIRGISYIYPLFYRFGLIKVPDKVARKMTGKLEK